MKISKRDLKIANFVIWEISNFKFEKYFNLRRIVLFKFWIIMSNLFVLFFYILLQRFNYYGLIPVL